MPTPPNTREDVAWVALMGLLVLPALFISMFTAAAYVTPWLLGVANCTEKDPLGKAIEFHMLFGGLIVGLMLGFGLFGILARTFASADTRNRWKEQFENGSARLPSYQKRLGHYFLRALDP